MILSAPSVATVSVDFAVSGGTATSDDDFTLPAGTLNFSPGETSLTVSLTLLDDSLREASETINITLSNAINATLNAPTSHIFTIRSSDYLSKGIVRGVSDTWKMVPFATSHDRYVAAFTPTYDENTAPMVVRTRGVLMQDASGTNHGLVVVEAENFDNNTARSGRAWSNDFAASYSGAGALRAMPDNDLLLNSAFTEASPELEYAVYFAHTGTHYVWVRGWGDAGFDDSCHVGIDGEMSSSADRIGEFDPPGSWIWENQDIDFSTVRIDVPTPGYHVINLWMREDGFRVDKLLLTTNAAYTPTGMGPDESSRDFRGDSCSVRMQNPSGESTPTNITAYYIVVEQGTYTEATDGHALEAYVVDSTLTDRAGSFAGQTVGYSNTYVSPILLGQVMSYNDTNWSVFWCSDTSTPAAPPSSSGLVIGKHVAEDGNTSRSNESIGYIIFEEGTGSLDNISFEAALSTTNPVGMEGDGLGTTPPNTEHFSWTSGIPMAVLSSAGIINTNEGGWPLLFGEEPLRENGMDLAFDEDQIGDVERVHGGEQVGYILFNSPIFVQFESSFSSGPPHQTNVEIRLSLSGPSSQPITVDVSVTGGDAAGPSQTNETAVTADIDDVEELIPDGTMLSQGSSLELGNAAVPQAVGIRFRNMPIPERSIVEEAYVQFTTSYTSTPGNVSTLHIFGDNHDDSPKFTSTVSEVSLRPKTTNTVVWSPPTWDIASESSSDQRTPDLALLVQELINRPGWSNGNAMSMIITGSGQRRAWTFDSGNTPPFLHTVFTSSEEQDYTLGQGSIVFLPGETSKVLTLTLLPSSVPEDSEFVDLLISAPTNAQLGIRTAHTFILDAYEVDDSSAEASVFPVGDTQLHTYHTSNDVDWIRFHVVTDYTYKIETTNVSSTLDHTLSVYLELPDGTWTNISVVNSVGAGLVEETTIDFPAEGECYTEISRTSGTGSKPGSYQAKVDLNNQGGVFIILAYDEVTRTQLPTGAVAYFDGIPYPLNGNTAVGIPGVVDGVHTVEVVFTNSGYLQLEDPKLPLQLDNENNALYGNPRKMIVDANGSNLAGYAGFSFIPTIKATANIRDRWTRARVADAQILFQATSGHIMSNHTLNGHAYYASYKTQWFTRTSGDFPTNVFLPATNAHLVISGDGFDEMVLSNAIFNISAGDNLDLGTLYLRPSDTNSNGIADSWETNFFGPGANIDETDDPDNDSYNNFAEYKIGTNPTNDEDALTVVIEAYNTNQVSMRWSPIADGRLYRPVYMNTPTGSTWITSPDGPFEGTNGQVEMLWIDSETPGQSGRWYRLELPFPAP